MKKVLIATEKPFAPVAVQGIQDIFKPVGYDVVLLEKYTEKEELLAAVADVDAIIIRSDKVDAEVIEAGKNLKIVVRAGAGYDNVDLEAATAHNVVVMNTPGQNSNAVAELVIGLLIYASRNMFNGTAGTELMGKKIGLLAFGAVAQNVARIAQGMGTRPPAARRKSKMPVSLPMKRSTTSLPTTRLSASTCPQRPKRAAASATTCSWPCLKMVS